MTASVARGLLLMRQGRLELAEREFKAALVDDPNDPQAHAFLAVCFAHRKGFKEATAEAAEAIRLAPDVPLGHAVMAQILSDRNRHVEAEAAIREAIRLDAFDPDQYAALADIKHAQREWPAMLLAAEQGLEIDPSHVACTNLRAMALVKLGRRSEAGVTIDTALARNPDNALTHANQGWKLLHDGDHRKALEHFREALRLQPGHDWARMGIVEALKARNFIYRWMLLYFLWMSRLSSQAQWGIMVGGYVAYMVMRNTLAKNPSLTPVLLPLIIAYFVFAIMTWLADPLFNLLLRFNRFGKYALSRDQVMGSNILAGFLLAGLGMLGAWFVLRRPLFLEAAIGAGLMMLPASAIFRVPRGWPRTIMVAGCAALLLIGGVAFGVEFSADSLGGQAQRERLDVAKMLKGLMLSGIFIATIGVNFLSSAQVRQ